MKTYAAAFFMLVTGVVLLVLPTEVVDQKAIQFTLAPLGILLCYASLVLAARKRFLTAGVGHPKLIGRDASEERDQP
jgi:drug/metabolite transporter (DMT)-like permease